ncbi:MAG: helix-turn-helix domain-containing protein [Oceanicaulis sp.]
MTRWRDYVRGLRGRLGLSQAVLAERLGVDQTAVSRWERGLDAPRMALRRRLVELGRSGDAARQDQVVRARVRNALWPASLVAPGAVFLEINPPALAEAGLAPADLRGRPIYGLFGPAVDDVTERWEATGVFRGEMAMTISLNTLETSDGQVHVKTLDTPHFTADGDVWCVCEIRRISAERYVEEFARYGGHTFQVPFDALADPA